MTIRTALSLSWSQDRPTLRYNRVFSISDRFKKIYKIPHGAETDKTQTYRTAARWNKYDL